MVFVKSRTANDLYNVRAAIEITNDLYCFVADLSNPHARKSVLGFIKNYYIAFFNKDDRTKLIEKINAYAANVPKSVNFDANTQSMQAAMLRDDPDAVLTLFQQGAYTTALLEVIQLPNNKELKNAYLVQALALLMVSAQDEKKKKWADVLIYVLRERLFGIASYTHSSDEEPCAFHHELLSDMTVISECLIFRGVDIDLELKATSESALDVAIRKKNPALIAMIAQLGGIMKRSKGEVSEQMSHSSEDGSVMSKLFGISPVDLFKDEFMIPLYAQLMISQGLLITNNDSAEIAKKMYGLLLLSGQYKDKNGWGELYQALCTYLIKNLLKRSNDQELSALLETNKDLFLSIGELYSGTMEFVISAKNGTYGTSIIVVNLPLIRVAVLNYCNNPQYNHGPRWRSIIKRLLDSKDLTKEILNTKSTIDSEQLSGLISNLERKEYYDTATITKYRNLLASTCALQDVLIHGHADIACMLIEKGASFDFLKLMSEQGNFWLNQLSPQCDASVLKIWGYALVQQLQTVSFEKNSNGASSTRPLQNIIRHGDSSSITRLNEKLAMPSQGMTENDKKDLAVFMQTELSKFYLQDSNNIWNKLECKLEALFNTANINPQQNLQIDLTMK